MSEFMIYSMTAFARREIKSTWGTATWELRSVNKRYLDICIRLPEELRCLEPQIYKRICNYITRGRIECTLHFSKYFDNKVNSFINKELIKRLIISAQWIKMQTDEGIIDPMSILRWPGVIVVAKQDIDFINTELLSHLDYTLDDFILTKKTEGIALKKLIKQYLSAISTEVVNIRQYIPKVMNLQQEKLLNKVKIANITLDKNRLEQELLILLQKIDITEEIERLEIHIKEIYNILSKKEAIGRRLDFMMQELNRESNTLASKSVSTEITTSVIELKVLIEQIREQIQNIE